jgi:DNA-binding NarL/FixJ family response regulator
VTTRHDDIQHDARTVLVIDDQRAFADLLQRALAGQPDVVCVDVAYDVTAGLELVEQHRPDVVILDVCFDDEVRDGVDVAREIRAGYPDTRVVLLTGQTDPSLVGRAAVAGAHALMAKNGSIEEILQSVRDSRSGGLTVDTLFLQALTAVRAPEPGAPTLTRRESDVLGMLVLGLDAKAISDQLQISVNTCRSYIKTLLSKLNAHSQLEAVAIARRRGLLDSAGMDDRAEPALTGTTAAATSPGPRQPSWHALS